MIVKMPQVEECCCFSLKTGVKIVGFLSLSGSLLLVIISGLELVDMSKFFKDVYDQAAPVYWLDMALHTAQAGFSLILLMGVYQNKAKLIPPWLVSTAVVVLLELVFVPSSVGRLYEIDHSGLCLEMIIVTYVIALADDVIGWLVVFSYYRRAAPQWPQSGGGV